MLYILSTGGVLVPVQYRYNTGYVTGVSFQYGTCTCTVRSYCTSTGQVTVPVLAILVRTAVYRYGSVVIRTLERCEALSNYSIDWAGMVYSVDCKYEHNEHTVTLMKVYCTSIYSIL